MSLYYKKILFVISVTTAVMTVLGTGFISQLVLPLLAGWLALQQQNKNIVYTQQNKNIVISC